LLLVVVLAGQISLRQQVKTQGEVVVLVGLGKLLVNQLQLDRAIR
jgi:hypothetical protein